MKITDIILYEAPVQRISKQEAINRGMFGPVYHGTTEYNRTIIQQQGFKTAFVDDVSERNGYYNYDYYRPIHSLGLGIYFTPSKTVAKQYNQDSLRGIIEYYLDVPRLAEIGFTSLNTIRGWWYQNGFDLQHIKTPSGSAFERIKYQLLAGEQLRATQNMTKVLSSKYDAVYLRRNSYRRGVDSEQIVVFDPKKIYQIDKNMSSGWDVGSKVIHNQNIIYSPELIKNRDIRVEKQPDGWTFITAPVYYMSDKPDLTNRFTIHKIPPPGMKGLIVKSPFGDFHDMIKYPPGEGRESVEQDRIRSTINQRFWNQAKGGISVKWQKGGIMHNYIQAELDPINPEKD
jgi:ADP-Ribosyltransferase in polyvalent proteins